MKQESLLEKAKKATIKSKTDKNIDDEKIQLALAWAKREISLSQVQRALGFSSPTTYSFLAIALRRYIESQK